MQGKKRSEKRKRTELVQFRMTKEEKSEYLLRCKKAGLTAADYFRKSAMKSKPLQPTIDTAMLVKLLASWGKMGNNLNQIAKHYNSGTATDQVIGQELVKKVEAIRLEIRQALGHDL
ncbi:MAG: MobC family plasmid mobilization relaxosome protein [Cellulophaga sp.]